MSITIIITICVCLLMHRHLSSYWEVTKKPYPSSFIFNVILLNIITAINLLWIFGIWLGFILFLLTYFQIVFSTILWPFLLPSIIRDRRLPDIAFMALKNKPDKSVFKIWVATVYLLLIFTILNFFVGSYSVLKFQIIEYYDYNYLKLFIHLILIIIAGNALRLITMRLINN